MNDILKAVLNKAAASLVAVGAGYVAVKTGVAVGIECQTQVAEVLTGGLMLGVYGITHVVLPQTKKK